MAFRRLNVLPCFQLGEPRFDFLGRRMQAGSPILLPRLDASLQKHLAPLLALDVLTDGLLHQPVGRAVPRVGQALHALLHFRVDLDRHGADVRCAHRLAMRGGFLCDLAVADSCGLVPEPEFRFTRMVRPGSGRLHLHDVDFVPPCQRKGELALGPGLADEALAHEREVSAAGSPG